MVENYLNPLEVFPQIPMAPTYILRLESQKPPRCDLNVGPEMSFRAEFPAKGWV